MNFDNVKYVLTDIEGTTTSVDFVFETLFPYFRENRRQLLELTDVPVVRQILDEVKRIAAEEGVSISSDEAAVELLNTWSMEDRKITPLKDAQGILWDKGYRTGELKGHVYADVAPVLETWSKQGLSMGVFSSGSVPAQKLIFGFSVAGDLTPYFSNYYDTKTGGKREEQTYYLIAEDLKLEPSEILFLSDIKEELEAAAKAGFQTCQLVREKTVQAWPTHVADFSQISL
ncbi:MAG: acireductone synthase [Crocinitomicaceae bacterium]|jgi:enolase-phosphatase E1|nr:acireductone synthase [Crocinitomicaceae bacterium]